MKGVRIGCAMTGSFCTFEKAFEAWRALGERAITPSPAGQWISTLVSGGPASSSVTCTAGSSERRAASTQPAEPPPTIT